MSAKKDFPLLVKLSSFMLPYQIEQKEGKLTQYIEIVVDGGKLLMNTSKVNYSFGNLHTVFLESFKKLEIQNRNIKKVLVLGFGGGSVVAMLNDDFNINTKTIGIEADEVVIELAKKHFNLNRFNDLTLINDDAFNYVLNCKEQFDLIAVDVFIDDVTPTKFSSKEFILALNKLIAPNGLVCYNRMLCSESSKNEANKLIKLITESRYQHLLFEYKLGGSTNWMIVYENK